MQPVVQRFPIKTKRLLHDADPALAIPPAPPPSAAAWRGSSSSSYMSVHVGLDLCGHRTAGPGEEGASRIDGVQPPRWTLVSLPEPLPPLRGEPQG